MTYLLDTCILSKLRKINDYPDRHLETWVSQCNEIELFLSVLTIAEIEQGIHKLTRCANFSLREKPAEINMVQLVYQVHPRI